MRNASVFCRRSRTGSAKRGSSTQENLSCARNKKILLASKLCKEMIWKGRGARSKGSTLRKCLKSNANSKRKKSKSAETLKYQRGESKSKKQPTHLLAWES